MDIEQQALQSKGVKHPVLAAIILGAAVIPLFICTTIGGLEREVVSPKKYQYVQPVGYDAGNDAEALAEAERRRHRYGL